MAQNKKVIFDNVEESEDQESKAQGEKRNILSGVSVPSLVSAAVAENFKSKLQSVETFVETTTIETNKCISH